MTYKQSATFGTAIGGCCSLFANLFIAAYLVVVFFGFFSTRDYSSTSMKNYQSLTDPETYDLGHDDLIVAVRLLDLATGSDNNLDFWDVSYS